MSNIKYLKQIEALDVNQLAEALEFNGYGECTKAIQTKSIDGEQFLKLTEVQISLWRLPNIQSRRLWSFIQQIREDPKQFLLNTMSKTPALHTSINSKNRNLSNNTRSKHLPDKLNGSDKFLTLQIPKKQPQSSEYSMSTLSKFESTVLKNKLELMFKKDESPNSSFVYNQRQPRLPPKPDHLKFAHTQREESEQFSDDYNDGYLSPIKVESKPPLLIPSVVRDNETNRGSFLSKFRKGCENLEVKRPTETRYEGSSLPKPLPSKPVPSKLKLEEELPEYTPVIEDDVLTTNNFNTSIKLKSPSNISNISGGNYDEEEILPEYTSIEDEVELLNKNLKQIINRALPPLPRLPPLPPLPISKSHTFNNNVPQTTFDDESLPEYTPIVEDDASNPNEIPRLLSLPHQVVQPKLIKAKAALPKPPLNLPKPPNHLLKIEDDLRNFEMDKIVNEAKQRPLPQLPPFIRRLKPENSTFNRDLGKIINEVQQRPLPPIPPTVTSHFDNNLLRKKAQQSSYPVLPSCSSTNKADLIETDDDDIEEEIPYYSHINLKDESSYRETDRKGARLLLAGLEEGAFVIRPSRLDKYLCTFSIIHRTKMFNLGLEQNSEGELVFGSVTPNFEQPTFYTISDIIEYYSNNPLYLSGEVIILKNLLPSDKH